jgi:cytidyltransferase-like protein
MTTGMIHGRFQPFHNGHMEYLSSAAELCQTLVVGITNPDPTVIAAEPEDALRHLPESNPFSYRDRYRMVRDAAAEAGLNLIRIDIVPFPINDRSLWCHYLPSGATQYIRVFSPWGKRKRELLEAAGFTVVDLARGEAKRDSGSEVREALRAGTEWQPLVPPAVARVINEASEDVTYERA